jgi:hypothetical protein
MGTGLSPNAIGLPDDGCATISLNGLDKILSVDVAKKLVTVQAGIKVCGLLGWLFVCLVCGLLTWLFVCFVVC